MAKIENVFQTDKCNFNVVHCPQHSFRCGGCQCGRGGRSVYFNFQGVRVENPEKGMYIRVVNNKAEKVVL